MSARKSEVNVEWVPLASLRAYDGNAKKHDYVCGRCGINFTGGGRGAGHVRQRVRWPAGPCVLGLRQD